MQFSLSGLTPAPSGAAEGLGTSTSWETCFVDPEVQLMPRPGDRLRSKQNNGRVFRDSWRQLEIVDDSSWVILPHLLVKQTSLVLSIENATVEAKVLRTGGSALNHPRSP